MFTECHGEQAMAVKILTVADGQGIFILTMAMMGLVNLNGRFLLIPSIGTMGADISTILLVIASNLFLADVICRL